MSNNLSVLPVYGVNNEGNKSTKRPDSCKKTGVVLASMAIYGVSGYVTVKANERVGNQSLGTPLIWGLSVLYTLNAFAGCMTCSALIDRGFNLDQKKDDALVQKFVFQVIMALAMGGAFYHFDKGVQDSADGGFSNTNSLIKTSYKGVNYFTRAYAGMNTILAIYFILQASVRRQPEESNGIESYFIEELGRRTPLDPNSSLTENLMLDIIRNNVDSKAGIKIVKEKRNSCGLRPSYVDVAFTDDELKRRAQIYINDKISNLNSRMDALVVKDISGAHFLKVMPDSSECEFTSDEVAQLHKFFNPIYTSDSHLTPALDKDALLAVIKKRNSQVSYLRVINSNGVKEDFSDEHIENFKSGINSYIYKRGLDETQLSKLEGNFIQRLDGSDFFGGPVFSDSFFEESKASGETFSCLEQKLISLLKAAKEQSLSLNFDDYKIDSSTNIDQLKSNITSLEKVFRDSDSSKSLLQDPVQTKSGGLGDSASTGIGVLSLDSINGKKKNGAEDSSLKPLAVGKNGETINSAVLGAQDTSSETDTDNGLSDGIPIASSVSKSATEDQFTGGGAPVSLDETTKHPVIELSSHFQSEAAAESLSTGVLSGGSGKADDSENGDNTTDGEFSSLEQASKGENGVGSEFSDGSSDGSSGASTTSLDVTPKKVAQNASSTPTSTSSTGKRNRKKGGKKGNSN